MTIPMLPHEKRRIPWVIIAVLVVLAAALAYMLWDASTSEASENGATGTVQQMDKTGLLVLDEKTITLQDGRSATCIVAFNNNFSHARIVGFDCLEPSTP